MSWVLRRLTYGLLYIELEHNWENVWKIIGLKIKEIEYIPEPLLNEIVDFIQFLKQKHLSQQKLDMVEINRLETALLSESSLAKDWSTKEENEAWQHL